MERIKGYTLEKNKYLGKINKLEYANLQINGLPDRKNVIRDEFIQVEEKTTNDNNSNSFALVVVRKLPWYKKLIRNIRNFIVVYRWRKAR